MIEPLRFPHPGTYFARMALCCVLIPAVLGLTAAILPAEERLPSPPSQTQPLAERSGSGVRFSGTAEQVREFQEYMQGLLMKYGWSVGPAGKIVVVDSQGPGSLFTVAYRLNTPRDDTDTLHLREEEKYGLGLKDAGETITCKMIAWDTKDGKWFSEVKDISRTIATEKEILAAYLQHGRELVLEGPDAAAGLRERLGLRWSVVRAAATVDFALPNESNPSKSYEEEYWKGMDLWELGDKALPEQAIARPWRRTATGLVEIEYKPYCWDACAWVYAKGFCDYYTEVSRQPLLPAVREALTKKDRQGRIRPLKTMGRDLCPDLCLPDDGKLCNWIPGDWAWFDNRHYDKLTASQKEQPKFWGDQGSQTIYIGGGIFVDLYNGRDRNLKEKVLAVWGWNKPPDIPDEPEAHLPEDQLVQLLLRPYREGGWVSNEIGLPPRLP